MQSITEKDLQVPRSAAEFRPFVETAIESICSCLDGKLQIRFRKGIAKPLIEEALPLGLLCKCYFKADPRVTVKHVLGNQNYDAEIVDNRPWPAPFRYIEITQAHQGENEYLRMLALDRDGHVNVLGGVRKTGTKHTGITVEVENEAKRHSDVLAAELKRIREAISRKAGKSYPGNTGLLVVFDDYVAIKDDDDVAALRGVLREGTMKVKEFCWIGAAGWSGKTFVDQNVVVI
jgi:hypothetical protein